jgi:hypothetical protein
MKELVRRQGRRRLRRLTGQKVRHEDTLVCSIMNQEKGSLATPRQNTPSTTQPPNTALLPSPQGATVMAPTGITITGGRMPVLSNLSFSKNKTTSLVTQQGESQANPTCDTRLGKQARVETESNSADEAERVITKDDKMDS